MSYIEEFEKEMRKQYDECSDEDVFFRWVSKKVLESYRNGISAGRKSKRENGSGVERQADSTAEVK